MSAPFDLPPEATPRDHAVAWCVRLASDAAEEADWLAFETWLAASPDHQRAYAAVESLWAYLDEVPPAAVTTIVPLRPRPTRRPVVWVGAIAASLVAAVLVGVGLWSAQPTAQSFQTALGERRVVALQDGSQVTLNGGSRITATIGWRSRRVVMADAEAVFDVAKDPRRPFLVQVGDREIRVVGTQFNVLRHAGDVRITVRRGVVEVRPADSPSSPPLARLVKGQSLAHTEGQRDDAIAAADPETAFAWTEGRLVFHGESLAEVAATLNRYVATPITVAPEARNVPVTATLSVGGEDEMLRTLSAFLPVQAERHPDSVRLSLRHKAR
jgi:transmembrane sensor